MGYFHLELRLKHYYYSLIRGRYSAGKWSEHDGRDYYCLPDSMGINYWNAELRLHRRNAGAGVAVSIVHIQLSGEGSKRVNGFILNALFIGWTVLEWALVAYVIDLIVRSV
jgi:hypothetical protein